MLILVVLLLSACQSNSNQTVDSMFEKKTPEPVVNVEPNVQVYSTYGSAAGYVIHVEDREKWIVTIGSVVRAHPKALVVLANEQQLEGEVRYVDVENNIALLSIKSSANIIPYELANDSLSDVTDIGQIKVDNNTLQTFTSFHVVKGEMQRVPVPATTIEQALKSETKLTMNDRLAFYEATNDYPEYKMFDMTVFEQYGKNTFAYNPDQIEQFSNAFMKDLNGFLENGQLEAIEQQVASDDLKDKIVESMTTSPNGTFTSLKTKAIYYADYQYIVEMESQYVTAEKKEDVTIILKLIAMDKEYKVIVMKVKEK